MRAAIAYLGLLVIPSMNHHDSHEHHHERNSNNNYQYCLVGAFVVPPPPPSTSRQRRQQVHTPTTSITIIINPSGSSSVGTRLSRPSTGHGALPESLATVLVTAGGAVTDAASLASSSSGGGAATATAAGLGATGSSWNPLTLYFLETVISNGVPAFFTIVVLGFVAYFIGRSRKESMDDDALRTDNPVAVLYDDLYGDQEQQGNNRFPFFGGDGDGSGGGGRYGRNRRKLSKNSGIPKLQYLKVTHLNRKYDSYDYSLALATQSKATAAAQYRKVSFSRALEKALGPVVLVNTNDDSDGKDGDEDNNDNATASTYSGRITLTPHTMRALQEAEEKFLTKGQEIVADLQKRQTQLTQQAIDEELKRLGLKSAFELDPVDRLLVEETTGTNTTSALQSADSDNATTETVTKKKQEDKKKDKSERSGLGGGGGGFMGNMRMGMITADIANDLADLQSLELEFVRQVVRAVGPTHGPSVRAALLGDVAARGTGGLLLLALEDRPLTQLLSSSSSKQQWNSEGVHVANEEQSSRRVFLTRFPGDVQASQVATLREEVTAIVRAAQEGDQALMVLQTGGGTVTGYGLAAAQLLRFKEAGIKLTIAVEQVAASGGYMMCCVADRIVASPFAVLGSIGVLTEIPNVYDRLKKEGIEFQTVTAGKYKRTLTPTKKVTQADFDKTKEDIEEILVLFRDFVSQNRPQLDIDDVATGETWFGTAALERNLCDEIKTVDDVIMDFVNTGYNVYEVKYSPPPSVAFPGLFGNDVDANINDGNDNDDLATTGGRGGGGLVSNLVQQSVRWLVQVLFKEIKRAAVLEDLNSSSFDSQQRYRAQDDIAQRVRAQDHPN